MSYICEHPALGAAKSASHPNEVLRQKESMFLATVTAASHELQQHCSFLSEGLYYAALEYQDAVHYALQAPRQPHDGEAVRYE